MNFFLFNKFQFRTIKSRIYGIVAFSVISMLAFGSFNILNAKRFQDLGRHAQEVSFRVLEDVNDFAKLVSLKAVIVGSSASRMDAQRINHEKQMYLQLNEQLQSALGRVEERSDVVEIRQMAQTLREHVKQMDILADQVFTKAAEFFQDEAMKIMDEGVMPEFQKIQELIVSMQDRAKELAEREPQIIVATASQTINLVLLIGIALTVALALIGAWIAQSCQKLLRGLIQTIEACVSSVTQVNEQLQGMSQELTESANSEATAIAKTSATLEHLTNVVAENEKNSLQANKLALQAKDEANVGQEKMKSMLGAMELIATASQEVGKIITTINSIAFQTNLLALNAAVEAARAGELGAGFAVVADEVRSLASKSADAARETAEKIEAAKQRSLQGADLSKVVSANFADIVQRTNELSAIVQSLTRSTTEQGENLRQVNSVLNSIVPLTQQNAEKAEETMEILKVMRREVASLEQVVRELEAFAR